MSLSNISSAYHSGAIDPQQEELAALHSLLDFIVEEEAISKDDKGYITSSLKENDNHLGVVNKVVHLRDVAKWVIEHAGGISSEIKSSLKRAVVGGLRF